MLQPGTQVGRFVLESVLGKGAAGVVYLATDTLLKQKVALKVLHEAIAHEREVRERFKREILLTRRVTHPGVARIHDMHEDGGLTYLTMEYVEGRTLAAEINDAGQLPPWRAAQLLAALAGPLAAAHAAGVVHRDLKPGNIIVKPDGRVAILDFGMATADDVARITKTGRTVGSLRFIAPEVWEGQPATALSDLYAVGVILFACIAGRLPYDASTPAQMFAALKGPMPSLLGINPDATPAIDEVVKKAMARAPGDRYQTIEALLAAFQAACDPASAGAGAMLEDSLPQGETLALPAPIADDTRSTPTVTTPERKQPPPALWIAAAAAALLLLLAVVVVLSSSTDEAAPPPAPAIVDAPAPEPAPERTPAPPPSATESAREQVLGELRRRGFLPGDLPQVDKLLAAARAQEARGDLDEAARSLARARTIIAKQRIDRGFVTTKLKRLHAALERAPVPVKDRVRPIEAQIERKSAARDYEGANAELNRALAVVGGR